MGEKQVRRIAIFGGTFDPPHFGHVSAVAYVLSCTEWREVFVIPCHTHPFGKKASPFELRLEMARAAFEIFGRCVQVLDLEARLPKPSYTVRTVEHLLGTLGQVEVGLVVGRDVAAERHRWHRFDELKRMVRFVVLDRPVDSREEAEEADRSRRSLFPDISSSRVREALRAGQDVSWAVPSAVLDVIRRERLYGAE